MAPASSVRSLSVFSAEGPSDALSRLMKDRDLGNPTSGADVLDSGVPLGAPKPSVLIRLRSSGGRNIEQLEQRANAAEMKLRKAQEYKEKKEAAAAKKLADAKAMAAASEKK